MCYCAACSFLALLLLQPNFIHVIMSTMRQYGSVADHFDSLADAHEAQANDTTEHAHTREGAQKCADYYREEARQARQQLGE